MQFFVQSTLVQAFQLPLICFFQRRDYSLSFQLWHILMVVGYYTWWWHFNLKVQTLDHCDCHHWFDWSLILCQFFNLSACSSVKSCKNVVFCLFWLFGFSTLNNIVIFGYNKKYNKKQQINACYWFDNLHFSRIKLTQPKLFRTKL